MHTQSLSVLVHVKFTFFNRLSVRTVNLIWLTVYFRQAEMSFPLEDGALDLGYKDGLSLKTGLHEQRVSLVSVSRG